MSIPLDRKAEIEGLAQLTEKLSQVVKDMFQIRLLKNKREESDMNHIVDAK